MMSNKMTEQEEFEARMKANVPKLEADMKRMFENNKFDIEIHEVAEGTYAFTEGDKPLILDSDAREAVKIFLNTLVILMSTNGGEEDKSDS